MDVNLPSSPCALAERAGAKNGASAPFVDSASIIPAALLYGWAVVLMLLWYVAFMQVPDSAPDWIRRAQVACFGESPNGLPNGGGWLLLIGGPLSLLISLVVAYFGELARSLTEAMSSFGGKVFPLLLLMLLCYEAWWIQGRISQALARGEVIELTEGSFPDEYPRLGTTLPGAELVDQFGKTRAIPETGKVSIVSFVFAHCAAVCPGIVAKIQAARELLPRDKTQVILITLDPWRDTPGALPGVATQWELKDGEFVLSGEPAKVEAVRESFQVPAARDEKTGDISHPALVFLIDSEGKLAYTLNGPSPEWIVQATNLLLK